MEQLIKKSRGLRCTPFGATSRQMIRDIPPVMRKGQECTGRTKATPQTNHKEIRKVWVVPDHM